jgi:hypothetical protein
MERALSLATLGEKIRHLKAHGLEEGVSTRLLVLRRAPHELRRGAASRVRRRRRPLPHRRRGESAGDDELTEAVFG